MAVIRRTAQRLLAVSQSWHREDGQGMAEYAMVLLFIAVACVTVFTLFGNAVNNMVNTIATSI